MVISNLAHRDYETNASGAKSQFFFKNGSKELVTDGEVLQDIQTN
jgi:hypothetical protein